MIIIPIVFISDRISRPQYIGNSIVSGVHRRRMCTDRAARLLFIRLNQDKLHADLYQGLADAAAHGADLRDIGAPTILPSTFIGGPRQMWKLYHDAMAIVRYCEKPDLFITMTCNPQWIELLDAAFPGQTAQDRPDLIARLFKLKLDALLQDLIDQEVFSKVPGYLYTIEFQKRGLPHAHILLILHKDSKPRTPEAVDRMVCAEIPDKIPVP